MNAAGLATALGDPLDALVLLHVHLGHLRHPPQHRERETLTREEDETEPYADEASIACSPIPYANPCG